MSKRKEPVRKPTPQPAAKPAAKATPPAENGFPLWPLIALLAVTALVFWPMLSNQFTNWDDEFYVVQNALLRGPDWKGIFTQPVVSNYHPLTVLTLALNYQFSQLNPFSYQLVNWAMHLANTGLVFYLVWQMSDRRQWVALFTALIFALHPMHVESVAWVSERKDVLYTFFFLLALIQYWRYLDRQRWSDYGLVALFFILSLLSKPAAVVLPLVLLLLDYWKGRPFTQRVWLEKLPLLALSLLFGILTLMIQSKKAMASLESYFMVDRLFFGTYGLVAYLQRFVVPAPLSAFHPYPPVQNMGWAIRVAPVVLLALAVAVWYFRKNKALVFGALFYVVNLILVVQFVAIGNTLLSERYTYMPYIGVAFALGMLLAQQATFSKQVVLQGLLLAVVGLGAGYLTRQHVRVWKNSETLWTDVIEHYPAAKIPRTNRANYVYNKAILPENAQKAPAMLAQAMEDCTAALATDPKDFKALDTRSIINLRQNRPEAALTDAEALVRAYPDSLKGYVVRGFAYRMQKKYDEALADYNFVLARDPNNADVYNGRGTALFNGKKQYREALADFEKAISLKEDGQYYLNRSNCHYVLGNPKQALADAEKARQMGTAVPQSHLEMLKNAAAAAPGLK